MDIENIQNQLFFERSEEFLEEKSAEYIVVSPLYSSFVTRSYEYRLGVYMGRIYT